LIFIFTNRWRDNITDLETLTMGLVVLLNTLGNKSFKAKDLNRKNWIKISQGADDVGVNVMSLSEITGIPRITVIRKIKKLVKDNILTYLAEAGLAVLILNVVMMTLAYFIAKKFVSGIAQQKCIALECGLQNGTLAVFVATLIFDDLAYVIPTAAYALTMYITGFIFIYILKKSN
jgi:hypothetical protein